MKKKISIAIIVALLLVFFNLDMDAQCAMCKLNAENAAKGNEGFAEGLNNGILYLMGIPYILLFTGGLVFYKKIVTKPKGQE